MSYLDGYRGALARGDPPLHDTSLMNFALPNGVPEGSKLSSYLAGHDGNSSYGITKRLSTLGLEAEGRKIPSPADFPMLHQSASQPSFPSGNQSTLVFPPSLPSGGGGAFPTAPPPSATHHFSSSSSSTSFPSAPPPSSSGFGASSSTSTFPSSSASANPFQTGSGSSGPFHHPPPVRAPVFSHHSRTTAPVSTASLSAGVSSPSPSTLRGNLAALTPSPTLGRRDDSSSRKDMYTAATPIQEGGTTYYIPAADAAPSAVPGGNGASGAPFVAARPPLLPTLPEYTAYTGTAPYLKKVKPQAGKPGFFMGDELRNQILKNVALRNSHFNAEANPDLPDLPIEVDSFTELLPLEDLRNVTSAYGGNASSVYKVRSTSDGQFYCMKRIHGCRLPNQKCLSIVDMWKKVRHPNTVTFREFFTTKAFGDSSLIFVYDYIPDVETLMNRHFSSQNPNKDVWRPSALLARASAPDPTRPYSQQADPREELLPEGVIWNYVIQLSSALRTIHHAGLACRTLEPNKILIGPGNRVRLNGCGIFDVIGYDNTQSNPLQNMPHYQQSDMLSLGRLVLALACNSLLAIQRDNMQSAMELVSQFYSPDLRNLLLYLLQQRPKNVNDIMPMIGARFYTHLESLYSRLDTYEGELEKEVENGRLLRLMTKLNTVIDRQDLLDPNWGETGDRYILKLFRDFLFHQITEDGRPWLDLSHVVHCLNRLDAGASEKITLMSHDEQNVIVVSYAELKQCFDSSFAELTAVAQSKPPTASLYHPAVLEEEKAAVGPP
ncbi:unnamed protein product [Cyprideis torosa]|uniref:PAN2-PAN3 deadenylation complex subunit PAN3 n=1 Tax=Cyprideis torosa TaxID=163714 RepID=A0A7R8W5D2_9CRUS|nr:unnamed protein product [Cyprideis torosa]CAG0885134.1 unnamed protein product [Cyprideis torosa]